MHPLTLPGLTRRQTSAAWLALASIFFLGLAWIAALPPYEGMDEPGHYASIRHIAELHTIPIPGNSFLPQETIAYGHAAPMPYDMTKAGTGSVFFGDTNYAAFFNDPDKVSAYVKKYRTSIPHMVFSPSDKDNWETQHPPLYYIVMAPLLKATDALPFVTQFMFLRMASFLMAMAGLFIGLRASLGMTTSISRASILRGYLFYPLLAPIFISEFARIGNDSLCLLLMALLWSCILIWIKDDTNIRNALGIGILFALGLFTKALFLPILAGFMLFVALRFWKNRTNPTLTRVRIEAAKAFMLPVIIGGLWYVYKWKAFGVISGSLDEAFLAQHEGFFHGLLAHFTWPSFVALLTVSLHTWFLGGTLSESTLNMCMWLVTPLILRNTAFAAAYLVRLRHSDAPKVLPLPLWMYGCLFAGILYFALVCEALNNTDQVPGWYLNIMLPVAGLIYACGFESIKFIAPLRWLNNTLLVYGGFLLIFNLWALVTVVTGFSVATAEMHFDFHNSLACLGKFDLIMDRLSILAWPKLMITAFVASLACVCALPIVAGRKI